MPNRILITDTYHEEVRSRLGVGEDVLSDTEIDAPSVLPVAEGKVIASFPNYSNLTGDNLSYLYAAAVCSVAVILVPSMSARIKKAKKDFDFTIQNREVNWNKIRDQLQEEMNELLSIIDEDSFGFTPVFGVAGPTRAKESRRMR